MTSPGFTPTDPTTARLIEQTLRALQDMDQRIQMLRMGLAQAVPHLAAAMTGRRPDVQPPMQPQMGAPMQMASPTTPAWPGPAAAAAAAPGGWPQQAPGAWGAPSPAQGAVGAAPFGAAAPQHAVPPQAPTPAPGMPTPGLVSPEVAAPGQAPPAAPTAQHPTPPRPSFDGPDVRVPLIDVREGAGEYRIISEVPGAQPDTLELLPGPTPGTLSIKVACREEDAGDRILHAERGGEEGRLRFHRILPIGWDADTSAARADLSDGLLVVTVPKRARPATEETKQDVA